MTKKQQVRLISLGIALFIAGFQYYSQTTSPKITSLSPSKSVIQKKPSVSPQVLSEKISIVRVTKVVDGDTFEIATGQKVRMIGINTPETVDPRRPVQCFGKEASDKTKELLTGKTVRLEKDVSETDKYGRLLRYVYLEDTFVNQYLVQEGFASSSTYPPDIKYQDDFKAAETAARNAKKGLWNSCK